VAAGHLSEETTVSTADEATDRDLILAAYRDQLQAMTRGDTATLDHLLAEPFTLTHITGYRQPKAEWLAEMRAGQFRYHQIEQRTATLEVTGDTARLIGRFVVDASVYGSRARWRLQLAQNYARRSGRWQATSSVATPW
jgi:hypothetical protein